MSKRTAEEIITEVKEQKIDSVVEKSETTPYNVNNLEMSAVTVESSTPATLKKPKTYLRRRDLWQMTQTNTVLITYLCKECRDLNFKARDKVVKSENGANMKVDMCTECAAKNMYGKLPPWKSSSTENKLWMLTKLYYVMITHLCNCCQTRLNSHSTFVKYENDRVLLTVPMCHECVKKNINFCQNMYPYKEESTKTKQ